MTSIEKSKEDARNLNELTDHHITSNEMDIVEFAEKVLGIQLFEYQKILLRKIEKLPRDTQLLAGRRRFILLVPKKGE